MQIVFPLDTELTVCHYAVEHPDEQIIIEAGVPIEADVLLSSRANESDLYFGDLRFTYGVPNHLFTILE